MSKALAIGISAVLLATSSLASAVAAVRSDLLYDNAHIVEVEPSPQHFDLRSRSQIEPKADVGLEVECVCDSPGGHTSSGGIAGGVVGAGAGGAVGATVGPGPSAAGAAAGQIIGNEIGHHTQNGDVGEAFNEANDIHSGVTGENLIKAGPKN